jgi:hypothetical protein
MNFDVQQKRKVIEHRPAVSGTSGCRTGIGTEADSISMLSAPRRKGALFLFYKKCYNIFYKIYFLLARRRYSVKQQIFHIDLYKYPYILKEF